MIISMKYGSTPEQREAVIRRIEQFGCKTRVTLGEETSIVAVIGDVRKLEISQIERMDGVEKAVRIRAPYKLASREFHPEDTVFSVDGFDIGSKAIVIMAGPCAVENREQLLETAHAVKEAGAHILRGGAYKPRTSPYSFQGLGVKALEYLAEAREQTGLPVTTEVTDVNLVRVVAEYADILQIGARNMTNFPLLQAVGESQKPVLLKRGMMSTIEELLMASEYLLASGNERVILCERGIRTFETATRNTLDISAVPLLKQLSHLPVIIDPSHGTGKWDLVEPVCRAGIAAGADGLIVEVHPHPEEALSDGAQSLKPARFALMMKSLAPIAQAVNRTM